MISKNFKTFSVMWNTWRIIFAEDITQKILEIHSHFLFFILTRLNSNWELVPQYLKSLSPNKNSNSVMSFKHTFESRIPQFAIKVIVNWGPRIRPRGFYTTKQSRIARWNFFYRSSKITRLRRYQHHKNFVFQK